jgi:hypothetical protein
MTTTKGAVSEDLLASLHPLELKVIPHLKDGVLLSDLAKAAGMLEVEATRALQWLENKKALTTEPQSSQEVLIDENGRKAVQNGMPEARFLIAVRQGANTNAAIMEKAKLDQQEVGVSIGLLKKAGLIEVGKDNTITVTQQGMTLDTNLDESIGLLRKLEKHPLAMEKLSKNEQEAVAKLKTRRSTSRSRSARTSASSSPSSAGNCRRST